MGISCATGVSFAKGHPAMRDAGSHKPDLSRFSSRRLVLENTHGLQRPTNSYSVGEGTPWLRQKGSRPGPPVPVPSRRSTLQRALEREQVGANPFTAVRVHAGRRADRLPTGTPRQVYPCSPHRVGPGCRRGASLILYPVTALVVFSKVAGKIGVPRGSRGKGPCVIPA